MDTDEVLLKAFADYCEAIKPVFDTLKTEEARNYWCSVAVEVAKLSARFEYVVKSDILLAKGGAGAN